MNAQFDHSPQAKNNPQKTAENVGISMPSKILVHAKLEMTNPGDSDEQEADEMADSIVNGGKIARSVSTGYSGSGIALPSQFGSQLASLQGQGSRLYGNLKSQMESGFGRDFSDVRIHTGNAAAEMSNSISARAFTYGNDIYFNRGQFNPETRDGRHLIAHELAHVEQGNVRVSRKPIFNEMPNEQMCKHLNCQDVSFSAEEHKVVTSALEEAERMLEKAINSIDKDQKREIYFGKGNDYAKIKQNLQSIYDALHNENVRVLLHKDNRDRGAENQYNSYAFTSNKDDAIDIALRGLFFENGPFSLSDRQRAAALIHELAHDVIQANRPSDDIPPEEQEYYREEAYRSAALSRASEGELDYVIQNASNYEQYCLKFASKK